MALPILQKERFYKRKGLLSHREGTPFDPRFGSFEEQEGLLSHPVLTATADTGSRLPYAATAVMSFSHTRHDASHGFRESSFCRHFPTFRSSVFRRKSPFVPRNRPFVEKILTQTICQLPLHCSKRDAALGEERTSSARSSTWDRRRMKRQQSREILIHINIDRLNG